MTETLKNLFDDLKEIIRKQGYSECRYMYCERDTIAAENEFDDLIPLAKKYRVGFADLLNQDDNEYSMDMWELGDVFGWRIQRKIEEEIKKENKMLGEVL